MNLDNYKNVPLAELWVEWQIKPHYEYKDCLSCYSFKIVTQTQKNTDNANCVAIPLLWLLGLIKKVGPLEIVRNRNHIPSDPDELVKFIRKLSLIIKT